MTTVAKPSSPDLFGMSACAGETVMVADTGDAELTMHWRAAVTASCVRSSPVSLVFSAMAAARRSMRPVRATAASAGMNFSRKRVGFVDAAMSSESSG